MLAITESDVGLARLIFESNEAIISKFLDVSSDVCSEVRVFSCSHGAHEGISGEGGRDVRGISRKADGMIANALDMMAWEPLD